MITVGSLFSGIGGIDLGLERAGMTVIWQSETNPYAKRVLAKHWPTVPNLGDVTMIDWSEVERPDLICGGFPCQPVSVAGRRLGQDDERWLWPWYAAAVRHLRPGYVVVENVPGLLVRGFGDVLGDLADLGYDTEWESLPAAAFGAPHLRFRLFVVAHAQRQPNHLRRSELLGRRQDETQQTRMGSPDVANADGSGSQGHWGEHQLRVFGGPVEAGWSGWWSPEPDVGGTFDGFSAWLDRSGGLMSESHKLILAYADAQEARSEEVLRALRGSLGEEDLQWPVGGSVGVSPAAVLLAYLRQLQARCEEGQPSLACEEASAVSVRGLRTDEKPARPSHGRRPAAQRLEQPSNALHALSQLLARHAESAWAAYRRENASTLLGRWGPGWEDGVARVANGVPSRVDRLKALGNAVVPAVAEYVGRRIMEEWTNLSAPHTGNQ